jgi:hypothetical protein
MVFAVNCPPQAPTVGRQASSMARASSSAMRPAITAPTAS